MIPLSTFLLPVLAGGFQPLHADRAEASSFLKSNWNKYEENYHPSYVLDDDEKTAWVEGAEGDGVGESITLPLSTVARARAVKLQIRNGYQKSARLLTANGAPSKVTVIIVDGNGRESARRQLALARKAGFQDVIIDLEGRGIAKVSVVIDEVLPGSVYKDTCISDIRVFVDSDVPYNEKAERAKQAALRSWRKERLETARLFAKVPPSWPWAATTFGSSVEARYQSTAAEFQRWKAVIDGGYRKMFEAKHPALGQLDDEAHSDLAQILRWRAGSAAPSSKLRRVETTGRRSALPDGVWLPEGLVPFLSMESLVLTEPSSAGRTRREPVTHRFMGEIGSVVFSDALVEGKTLLLSVTTTILERTESTSKEHWRLVYDDAGRLLRAAFIGTASETSGFMLEHPLPENFVTTSMPGEAFGTLVFVRNGAGKITLVEHVRAATECGGLVDETEEEEGCRFEVARRRFVAQAQSPGSGDPASTR